MLINNVEYQEITSNGFRTIEVSTFKEIEAITSVLTEKSIQTIDGVSFVIDHLEIARNGSKYDIRLVMYQARKEDLEKDLIKEEEVKKALDNLPSDKAEKYKGFYPKWEDLEDGTSLKTGQRITHDGTLFEVVGTSVKKDKNYPPNTTVSLYAELLSKDIA